MKITPNKGEVTLMLLSTALGVITILAGVVFTTKVAALTDADNSADKRIEEQIKTITEIKVITARIDERLKNIEGVLNVKSK